MTLTMNSHNAKDYFNQLNDEYLSLHKEKENLFWQTYMGTSDQHDAFAQAESDLNAFISAPIRITQTREFLAQEDKNDPDTLHGLKGWLSFFEANAIESESGREKMSALIKSEAELFAKRQKYIMHFQNDNGITTPASLTVLSANISNSDSEGVRQTSHQALLNLEQWVLENGYIELVKQRNEFARDQGYKNFFDYKINKTEQMSCDELFRILDDFEKETRDGNLKSIETLVHAKGIKARLGHNFRFMYSGDANRELDAYVPFAKSLQRWVKSFGRLNIDYSGAELTLDLLDREGKFQNGFCHGPIPSLMNNGDWQAAKVNFTSNAKPDQVGSGYNGINTLFHEGGHAAHFANVKQNAPCFSQEFAPTSMAYAETQSMFCDSLLNDADWLKLYASNNDGQAIPDELIKSLIESNQPFQSYEERSILVVPYFEHAVYSADESDLTPEYLTKLARKTEKSILGLETSPRPLLAIPHLLSQEAACSYQGYLLAHMAVYQTRAFFINAFGYLTDNPKIGPLLAEHYWKPGNSINHNATLESLTGEGFTAKFLAEQCNLTSEQAWQIEKRKIEALKTRDQEEAASLNADIKLVDGDHVICSNKVNDNEMCDQFEQYINSRYFAS
ncbi:M3 family metallopeptidase [Marinomonas sp. S3726]|uniref:M3 family metallopeptidase n=1 Tax=Marinomonas sp. S3726 TaxID=579484 RepID=UPI000B2AB65F|nr:M3 family metallopeptidase [Marinomonas sp. S3726]